VPSLWIGPPGRLREIPNAAIEFDRTVALGVSEFQAMGGGVTVTSLPTPPRRLALSWTGLPIDQVDWLDGLARRAFGTSPLAVLDPVTRNLLDGPQSQGYGPLGAWRLVGNGTLSRRADGAVMLTGTDELSQLQWRHPYWPGWPIRPGQRIAFASPLARSPIYCTLVWITVDGRETFGFTSEGSGGSINLPTEDTAFYVRPAVSPGTITTPAPIGPALLRMTDSRLPVPVGPVGDGGPAMAITGYTDRPAVAATTRDLSLTLVEVRRAGS
jgi:hypothetical protein